MCIFPLRNSPEYTIPSGPISIRRGAPPAVSIRPLAQFVPQTQTFHEYPLPGPDPTPYGLGFDSNGYLWYDSHEMDLLGRFDTKTGKAIEYPFPHPELAIREFFRDSEARMWYGHRPQ